MPWDFKNGIPIYQQLTDRIKISIASGSYQPDEKIASVRDLAMEAGVNPNTMQRALSQLESEGLLYSQRTSGRFITGDTQRIANLRSQLAGEKIRTLLTELGGLGMSMEEILQAVQREAGKDTL